MYAIQLIEISQILIKIFSRGIHNQQKYSLKIKYTFLMCHAYTTTVQSCFREFYKVKETEIK